MAIKGPIVENAINNKKLLGIIQKLNLNENGISNLKIKGAMPNARAILLNHNFIKTIDVTGIKNLLVL